LAGEISLGYLEEWYRSYSHIILEQNASSIESKLAGELELGLVEISAGRMSEEEFKEGLKTLFCRVNNYKTYRMPDKEILVRKIPEHNDCLYLDLTREVQEEMTTILVEGPINQQASEESDEGGSRVATVQFPAPPD